MTILNEALGQLGVKTKAAEAPVSVDQSLNNTASGGGEVPSEVLRLRVGGFDLRKQVFKGWVVVEQFEYRGSIGSFCVMQRDQVS